MLLRNYTLLILLIASVALFSFSQAANNIKKAKPFKTYLACSEDGRGSISAQQFKSLIKEKLCAKDSNGKSFPVTSFELIYAETGLFEDSTGLPIPITDYSFVSIDADVVSEPWQKLFDQNIHAGDTIKIMQVRVLANDGKKYQSDDIDIVIK